MAILSQLALLISKLNLAVTIDARQELISATDLDHLRNEIEFEGSALTFSGRLIRFLSARSRQDVLHLVDNLLAGHDWIGLEQQGQLAVLRDQIVAMSPDQWRNVDQRLPRVYISHNFADAVAGPALLGTLRAGLERSGFEVLVGGPRAGEPYDWRAGLFGGMGHCDGAVVLINEKALSEMEPVFAEAAILRWRDWREPGFKLLSVCLDEIAPSHLAEGIWDRLALSDAEIMHGVPADQLLDTITTQLEELKGQSRETTWLEELERELARRLGAADEQLLCEALNRIGTACEEDASQLYVPRQLARALLRKGLDAFPAVVEKTGGNPLSPVELEEILNQLAPTWVDLRAAGLIPKVAAKARDMRALCVNGDVPDFTGRMYLSRANPRPGGPAFGWRYVEVTADGIDATIQEIREGLIAQFRSLRRDYARLERRYQGDRLIVAVDKQINEVLAREEQKGEPVFVLFAPDHVDDEKLQRVRQVFPALTFFLLIGAATQDAPFDYVELLEPPLVPDAEGKAWDKYNDMLDRIPV